MSSQSRSPKERKPVHFKKTSSVMVYFSVGDKVLVKPDKKGQVVYVGEPKGWGPGFWYGIRLTEPRGDNDGEYKDKRFFRCPPKMGIFVQTKLIVRKLLPSESNFNFLNETSELSDQNQRKSLLYKAGISPENIFLENEELEEKTEIPNENGIELGFNANEGSVVSHDESNDAKYDNLNQEDSEKADESVQEEKLPLLERDFHTLLERFVELNIDNHFNFQLDFDRFKNLSQEVMELDDTESKELFDKADFNGTGKINVVQLRSVIDKLNGANNFISYGQIKEALQKNPHHNTPGLNHNEFCDLVEKTVGMDRDTTVRLFFNIVTLKLIEFEHWLDQLSGKNITIQPQIFTETFRGTEGLSLGLPNSRVSAANSVGSPYAGLLTPMTPSVSVKSFDIEESQKDRAQVTRKMLKKAGLLNNHLWHALVHFEIYDEYDVKAMTQKTWDEILRYVRVQTNHEVKNPLKRRRVEEALTKFEMRWRKISGVKKTSVLPSQKNYKAQLEIRNKQSLLMVDGNDGKSLKKWLMSNGAFMKDLFNELMKMGIHDPADLVKIKTAHDYDELIRRVRVLRREELKDPNAQKRMEAILTKFGVLFRKLMKKKKVDK